MLEMSQEDRRGVGVHAKGLWTARDPRGPCEGSALGIAFRRSHRVGIPEYLLLTQQGMHFTEPSTRTSGDIHSAVGVAFFAYALCLLDQQARSQHIVSYQLDVVERILR